MKRKDRRSRRAYGWPDTIRQPERPPKVVYLDLLHWIGLSKARAGHRNGYPFRDALDACMSAVTRGDAVFPISDSIYFEVSKMASHRRRHDLRVVIEELSSFRVLMARHLIARHEVETLLDRLIGPSPTPINSMDYLATGVMRAVGLVGGIRIRDANGEDVTDAARAAFPDGPEAFDRLIKDGELRLERMALEGPTPDEEPELRRTGWNPQAAYASAERRAEQEREQAGRFDSDPGWRGERIRDVVTVWEYTVELSAMTTDGIIARRADITRLFEGDDRDAFRAAFDSMPSFDVAVSLKTALHRNPAHPWSPNDIVDIDALGSSVPYCDVVVTDKEAASHLRQTGVADRIGTVVRTNLDDLLQDLVPA
jgi:hypothetical protein